jgi:hypothetical protein
MGFDGWATGFRLSNCERPIRLACALCPYWRPSPCGKSDELACTPCGRRYRNRVRQVIQQGIEAAAGDVWELTYTAPCERGSPAAYHEHRGVECPCSARNPGGVDLGVWNARSARQWNKVLRDLRRLYGDVQYDRCIEAQKRMALHGHLQVVLPTGTKPDKAKVRAILIHHGFGHSMTLKRARKGKAGEAAAYGSKYCSKAVGLRPCIPWVKPDENGEAVKGKASYRAHTHSRRWASSMRQVRAQQREWALRAAAERAACGAGGVPAVGGVLATLPPEAALDSYSRSYTTPALQPPLPGIVRPM